ncbi:MAG TPA: hypothetical protein VFR67_22670 [Pilimelia sp.]|nr:hypothetical protein [Pilimelia sp.]
MPILCLSGLGVAGLFVPSKPCAPPFVDDPSQCGPHPLATFVTGILAGGYMVFALVVALLPTVAPWRRILVLALAPLAAAPLLWAFFAFRPYG